METRSFTISEQGQRLDKFLCQMLNISRRDALRLLEQSLVTLNGRVTSQRDKGRLLGLGDTINLDNPEAVLSGLIAPELAAPLTILTKGEGYVVVDKPAHQPVMPLRSGETGTLLNTLVARCPQIQGVGEGGLRSGVVHRLDTDTSGTIVVATEQKQWQSLRKAFKEHRTTKLYHALVQGQLWGEDQERMHLTITQHRPAKVSVLNEPNSASRLCTLSWRALKTFEKATLLEVSLSTGFLHQIRVMFAHKGHPVIGDKTYGSSERLEFEVERQMLHATFLEVEGIKARSSYPTEFAEVLNRFRNES